MMISFIKLRMTESVSPPLDSGGREIWLQTGEKYFARKKHRTVDGGIFLRSLPET
jgi:hypothetical protein